MRGAMIRTYIKDKRSRYLYPKKEKHLPLSASRKIHSYPPKKRESLSLSSFTPTPSTPPYSILLYFPSFETIRVQEDNQEKISEEIIQEIKSSQTINRKIQNMNQWKSEVAPVKEIIKDLERTIEKTPMMFMSPKMGTALNIRAIEGHAQNGHGTFMGSVYQNTTTSDVLYAIEKAGSNRLRKAFSKKSFLDLSQRCNDTIVSHMEDWFKGIEDNISTITTRPDSKKFENYKSETLNGMTCLKGIDVDMLELARGFYLAANMDTLRGIRSVGEEKYGHKTGGGNCFLTSTKKMQEYGIDIKELTSANYKGLFAKLNNIPHNKRLDVLEELGIIKRSNLPLEDIAQGELTWRGIKSHPATTDILKNPGQWGNYIREKVGYGVGDDIAIFLAGFLPPSIYNEGHKESEVAIQSRIIGALLGDQMDTMEKSARLFIPGGHDTVAGKHINGLFKKLAKDSRFREKYDIEERPDNNYNLLSHNELVDFTMAAANTQETHIHSSQRWFYKKIQKTCAISEYMRYAYLCAMAENKDISLKNMRNFKVSIVKDPVKANFTFRAIPLKTIQRTFKKRLELVINPPKTPERLKEFYASQKEEYTIH